MLQKASLLMYVVIFVSFILGLAIVCDEYFVPSLTRFSDGKNLQVHSPVWYLEHIYPPPHIIDFSFFSNSSPCGGALTLQGPN